MGCKSGNCGGKCGDCKKIKAKELKARFCDPGYTGDIKYDGTAFICEADTDLNLAEGDNLNTIILAHAEKLCEHESSITTLEETVENFETGNNTYYAANSELDDSVTDGNTFDTDPIIVLVAGTYIVNFGAFANVFGGAKFEAYIRETTDGGTDYKSGREGVITNTEGTPEAVEMLSVSNTLSIVLEANDQIVLRFKATDGNIVALGYSVTLIKVA